MREQAKAWLITYSNSNLNKPPNALEDERWNCIVIGRHPVEWASRSSEMYRRRYFTVLHFFTEIPLPVALAQLAEGESESGWVEVEDHRR